MTAPITRYVVIDDCGNHVFKPPELRNPADSCAPLGFCPLALLYNAMPTTFCFDNVLSKELAPANSLLIEVAVGAPDCALITLTFSVGEP